MKKIMVFLLMVLLMVTGLLCGCGSEEESVAQGRKREKEGVEE